MHDANRENPSQLPKTRLSHIDSEGRASMVDVGEKPLSRRAAIAECFFIARAETLDAVMTGALPKGEALSVARIAGIQAAKGTDRLIPLCHSLPLDHASISFERARDDAIRVVSHAATTARTGVEMEALVGASVAALTLYDMTKAIDRELRIEGLRLVEKTKLPVTK